MLFFFTTSNTASSTTKYGQKDVQSIHIKKERKKRNSTTACNKNKFSSLPFIYLHLVGKKTAPKYILSKMLCHTKKKRILFLFRGAEWFWIMKDFCHKLQLNFSQTQEKSMLRFKCVSIFEKCLIVR